MVSRALAVISCLALPHGIGAAQPAPWPDIEPVAPPMCSLQPSLAVQPPFAGVPADLPSLASMPALAAMRDCFAQTVQAQAWSLFQSRAEQAPDHRMQVGGIHFLAHEGNISSFPLVALESQVEVMWRAGVRQVGVHFGTWPWLCDDELQAGCEGSSAAIAKYDALLAALEARQLPLRVMLPIAPSSRLPTTGWEDYVLDVTTMVARVLARYGAQISQVGMHEPSSVEKLILQAVNPTAVLDPTQWRMQLVDPVCTLVHGSGATCSASLIPGPFDNPQAEARFIDAAILSNADWLGVNNIQFYGLDPAVVQATEDFVLRFADGDLVGEEQGPARGLAHVFINAAWRPAWPMAAGRPLESNAAGTGCMELTAVDLSYLGALFAWARSMRLHSVNVFYTTSFVAQTNCDRDLRIYTSVHSSLQPGVLWPWYQIGNPISDGDYRLRIAQQLALPVPPLTAVGERHRLLSGIARSGSDLHADGFE